MIKKIISWLVESLAGLFENEVDPCTIRDYIEKNYSQLKKRKNLEDIVERDLTALEQTLIELGWLDTGKPAQANSSKIKIQTGIDWFGRQGLVPGAGQALEQLGSQGGNQGVTEYLEKILRHIEVKRENSLSKFTQPISNQDIWLERFDISILFSRTACRCHDLRFLNAALKMNQWYLRKIGNTNSVEITARFLRALAEQELCAKELLVC